MLCERSKILWYGIKRYVTVRFPLLLSYKKTNKNRNSIYKVKSGCCCLLQIIVYDPILHYIIFGSQ